MPQKGGVLARLAELEHEIRVLKRRTSVAGGGVPAAPHAATHSVGGDDAVDVTDLDGFPGGSPLTYLDSDGNFTDPPGSGGDVVGPSSATDTAFARFDGTTGKLIQNSPGTSLDDSGRAVLKALHIPLFDAGNSGTSKTLDWNDSNEQLLTLTGNVTLTLSNPTDGGRYVLLLASGAGGFTVTWPAAVHWPAATTPTITATASKYDLVTLIYLSGAGIYLASINQNYSA